MVGVFLLIFMIVVEGEPGLVPMLIIVSGIGWHLFNRNKIRSKNI